MKFEVICGAPCSGKTTYANERAREGDVIIDLDAIASALGAGSGHMATGAVAKVARAARQAAIEEARRVGGGTAYVIHS